MCYYEKIQLVSGNLQDCTTMLLCTLWMIHFFITKQEMIKSKIHVSKWISLGQFLPVNSPGEFTGGNYPLGNFPDTVTYVLYEQVLVNNVRGFVNNVQRDC